MVKFQKEALRLEIFNSAISYPSLGLKVREEQTEGENSVFYVSTILMRESCSLLPLDVEVLQHMSAASKTSFVIVYVPEVNQLEAVFS